MAVLKRLVTVALLLFVGATVGSLIAQEVGRPLAGGMGTQPSAEVVGTAELATEAPADSVSALDFIDRSALAGCAFGRRFFLVSFPA